ncbi:MAG TPA: glycosyltransferase family 4 protein [Vicinamibacterales bacterium]|nr:glycosyltransferase family 4 protein [Vicinamibacterales bacterium]
MLDAVAGAGVALALSWYLTGVLTRLPSRFSVLDYPNARSLHLRPTPRTGGLAIVAGFLAAVAAFLVLGVLRDGAGILAMRGVSWMIAMLAMLALVSYWDDCVHLPTGVRLFAHVIAALGVVLGGDLRIAAIDVPGIGLVQWGGIGLVVTILAVAWMTNLYNFMDGMDGLAGGMAVIGFSMLAAVAFVEGHAVVGGLAAGVAAAAAGFLRYNFPPARIFMGDIGSISLGFLAASLSLVGIRAGAFDVLTPVLVFSPFIVDATVTLLRRIAVLQPPWLAHRDHIYQRLVLAGWQVQRTTLAAYGLMIASGVSALIYQQASSTLRLVLLIAYGAIYCILVFLVRFAGSAVPRTPSRSPGGRTGRGSVGEGQARR